MDELEITGYLKDNKVTKRFFLGVLAYDELPYKQKNGFYIINSGHSSTKGTHWFTIFKQDQNIEFFDSLANNPSYYSPKIEAYLLRNANNYSMSLKRIQGQSDFCGNYCIIYSYLKCENYSMSDILKLFTDNLEINDHLVNFN